MALSTRDKGMEPSKVASPQAFPTLLLEEFLPLIQRESDPRKLCEEVVGFLTRRLGAEGGVWLSVDSRGGFFIKGGFGEGFEGLRGFPWDPQEKVKVDLYRGKAVTLQSLHFDPVFSKIRKDGLLTLAPLLTAGHLRGALGAFHSEPIWPSERLQEAMVWVGRVLAPALALCSFWEDLSIDEILERKIEQALGNLSIKEGDLLKEITEIVERSLISCVMKKVGNVQSAAARLLGINRNTLRKKLKDYGFIP
ncbi:MAG: hypothetical protein DRG31_03265 [Deltaproteobacteria bacterium]|nr:MAG: hypothetical protein DRG31_03265 [Deltaproteobacteria bacterium]